MINIKNVARESWQFLEYLVISKFEGGEKKEGFWGIRATPTLSFLHILKIKIIIKGKKVLMKMLERQEKKGEPMLLKRGLGICHMSTLAVGITGEHGSLQRRRQK